jgi:hypothetical protein
MNATTIPKEVRSYLDAVLALLGDVPAEELDDLTLDLETHLIEVHREKTGSLTKRLGTPAAYASELRSSAGLEVVRAMPGAIGRTIGAVRGGFVRLVGLVRSERVKTAVVAARPTWIGIRGWLGVCLAGVLGGWLRFTMFPLPRVSDNDVLGLALVVAATAASVKIARRAETDSSWKIVDRLASWGVGGLLVLSVSGVASPLIGENQVVYYSDPDPLESVYNIYAYDLDGNPIDQVLLFDQDGNPIDLNPWAFESTDEVRFLADAYGRAIKNAYPVEFWQWEWSDQEDTNGVPPTDQLVLLPPPRVAIPETGQE